MLLEVRGLNIGSVLRISFFVLLVDLRFVFCQGGVFLNSQPDRKLGFDYYF